MYWSNKVSVLSSLKLVSAKRHNAISPIQHRRSKLIARIDEQIELAQAMLAGQTLVKTRTRIIKNKETGESRAVEQAKRVRPWWFTDERGKLYLQIKYGSRTIELAKGKNSIELGAKDDLVKTLGLVRDAVVVGDLDSAYTILKNTN
jgi:hypothetical protein